MDAFMVSLVKCLFVCPSVSHHGKTLIMMLFAAE